jgi:DNA-binding CsgD family transcriptional regulator
VLVESPGRENDAVLVGRRMENECFSGVVRSLRSGQGAVLEVTGDPGIGKTSLLGLLARRAAAAGARVMRGQAAQGAAEPGQVVREVLDTLEVPRPRVANGSGPIAGAEVRGALGSWSAERGGVLVLDSLHLCDDQSARLIAQLVRTPPPGPFVLALGHRPRQSGPVLREALEYGVETGAVIRVAPAPLDVHAVSAWLDHCWARAVSASHASADTAVGYHRSTDRRTSQLPVDHMAYAEQLHAASGGNPRMLRILAAARWDPDEWPLSAGPHRGDMLREAASLITELDSLTADAATTAGVAAVLGDPFPPEDLAAVSGLDRERTLSALAELTAADLIRPLPYGGRYVFRHPVLGHVALERASPSLRSNAHKSALDLLTERGAPAVQRARQAEHLAGTGSGTALHALSEGAAEAMANAPALAARWLRLALDHLPTGTRISAPRVLLALDCCRALTAVGRLREARSLAHDLLRHQSHLSDELRLSVHAACGEAERLLGRYQEAEAVVCAGLDLVPRPLPVPLPAPAAELITAHGRVQLFRGTYGRARDVVREAARATETADPSLPYLRALAALGDTQLGPLPTAAREVTECARLLDALPDATTVTMPDVLAMLGCAELFQERFNDAYRHLERGLQATTGAARRYIRINQLVALCHLDQLTGRLDELCERAREAESLARVIGADEGAGVAMTLRASGLTWMRSRRDSAKLIALAAGGLSLAARGRGWRASAAVGLFAHVQFLGGDPAGCLRTLAEAGGPRMDRLLRPWQPSLLALASTAALRCGDLEAARTWAAKGEAVAEGMGLPLQSQYVRRARALLHAEEGDHHLAAGVFHEVAEMFRRAGLPVEHAWTLVAGARSVHAVDGTERALEWLAVAAKVSQACGAQRVREEAAQIRRRLRSSGAADASAGTVPDANDSTVSLLTVREREIAELAATGKRTREIADQLFVSTRTVETHLRHVYRKLDIRSRAALPHALSQAVRLPTA